MKRHLAIAVLLVTLLAVACTPNQEQEPTPTPIPTSVVPDKPTYVVQKGPVENVEEFTARVSPVNEEGLFFRKGGFVKVVYADKGDWVEEGDILAELELEDLMNQLSLAEVDLESAQKRYAAAEEAHQRDVFKAQLSLDTLKLRMEKALAQEPTADFTSQRIAVDRAADKLLQARIGYKEALDCPWEDQKIRDSLYKNIVNAERSYEETQARYQKAIQDHERAKELYAFDLQLLEMDLQKAEQELEWLERGVDPILTQQLESAQLKVKRLEDQMATGQLVAPFAGELTSLNVTPGRDVEAHKKVAVIADPGVVDIAADLTSNQMSVMEEGQAAEVTTSKAPGQIFQAIIAQMPYPYGTGGGEVKVEDQDERVHITLVNPDELALKAGDLVKARVLIERSDDALWVPPAAIRTFEGRNFVMVKEDDRLRKVDIRIGIEGEDRWEVLSGLEEGQIIEGL